MTGMIVAYGYANEAFFDNGTNDYQFTAAIGHLRTAWAALVDVARTVPATVPAKLTTPSLAAK